MKLSFSRVNIDSGFFSSLGKYLNKTFWANLFFCCSPLLVFIIILCVLRVNPFRWVPLYCDEVGWYMQVNSVIEYGMPPGYTGYNETHAAVGRFGPWGGFLICLMALFGKVFGWHWYSQLFMNVFFMVLANVVFVLFARPSRKMALKLTALNFVLFLSILYMFTGMSECTRFSLSVMLAGLFYYLLKDENKGTRRYFVVLSAVAPVMLLLFINCYFMFVFLLPVYGLIWYKRLNPQRCRFLLFVFLCAVLPAVFALVCLFIQVKTSSPYPSNTLLSYLNLSDLASFPRKFWETIVMNYRNASLKFIFNSTKTVLGCISCYLMVYYLILGVALVQLAVVLKSSRKLHPLILLAVYAMASFIFAFIAFYQTKFGWTFVRGLHVGFVFSLYLLCMLDWPRLHCFLFGLMFMQFFQITTWLRDDMAARYSTRNGLGGGYELFEKYSRVYHSKLVPVESEDPWDNTVAFYGRTTYNVNCTISPGLSWNYMFDNRPATKSRYIVTDKRRNWHFPGYEKTYSDDLMNIFEKVVRPLPTAKETGSAK